MLFISCCVYSFYWSVCHYLDTCLFI
jgi:hypothetical protein